MMIVITMLMKMAMFTMVTASTLNSAPIVYQRRKCPELKSFISDSSFCLLDPLTFKKQLKKVVIVVGCYIRR